MSSIITCFVLLLLVVASIANVAVDCNGEPVSCSEFSARQQCALQDGCRWSTATTVCSGEATLCGVYLGDAKCRLQTGCEWTGKLSSSERADDNFDTVAEVVALVLIVLGIIAAVLIVIVISLNNAKGQKEPHVLTESSRLVTELVPMHYDAVDQSKNM
mmetsp:Transcript_6420/g.6969  ORF Transcript_6420/g.6969 Transcript_6420/m.6969 type:complete len:159 (+) Transcript_6420:15-491(+)